MESTVAETGGGNNDSIGNAKEDVGACVEEIGPGVPDNDEEEDGFTGNPLYNEVVLRKVMSYLDQDDLKQCRLVNQQWNYLGVPFLKRKCCYISFNSDSYWTNIKNHQIDDMANFTKCANSSDNFPFVKLDLGTSVIKCPDHEDILASFFQTASQWITELTIRDEWGQHLFEHGPPEIYQFPCLEVFTIQFLQPMNNGEDICTNFRFFTNIMKHSPSLKKLMLIDHNGMDDGEVVTCFLTAVEESNSTKISHLEIEAQIENSHLEKLTSLGLKLTYLFLDFWGSVITQDKLKMFLATQSNTLQKLKIADFAMSSNFVVEFPCMKKVVSLMIKGSLLGRICVSFPNISYEKQFPALKRLSFSTAMEEWDEFLKFGIRPVQTVEELKLPGDFADGTCLHHAARIFPNIRKLEIPALLSITNIVYESMPNVEELILNTKYLGGLVDDIITGLSMEACDEVRSFPEMFSFLDKDDKHMQLITTKPISSLKRLKILRLKCKRYTDPVELTDVSCRLVLLKMNSLQCLDLWHRGTSGRVSEEVLHAMKKKFIVL